MLKSWFCIYRLNSLQILQIKSYSFLIYPKFCVPTSEMPKWTFLLKYRFGYKKAQKIQKFFDFRKVHNLIFLWIYTLLGVFPASKDLRPFVCSSLVQCWPMSGFFIYIYIYIYIYIWQDFKTCYPNSGWRVTLYSFFNYIRLKIDSRLNRGLKLGLGGV